MNFPKGPPVSPLVHPRQGGVRNPVKILSRTRFQEEDPGNQGPPRGIGLARGSLLDALFKIMQK